MVIKAGKNYIPQVRELIVFQLMHYVDTITTVHN